MSKAEDFLPYELGYLTPEMVEVAAGKDVRETDEIREKKLAELRNLIEGEKNLHVRTDDKFLLSFLRGRKFKVEKAFSTIKKYYKHREEFKHIYDNESNDAVHDVFRKNFLGFLPRRDKDGRVILVIKLGLWDPEEVSKDLLMWTMTHCLIHSIEDPATQVLGYTVLIDLNGCGEKHMNLCTPQNVKLAIHSSQVCFPGRFVQIHVIGAPKVFAKMYAVITPFLTNKLRKGLCIHGDDLKSLHKKVFPCILPSEYGGELGPFDNKPWHDQILSRNEWCLKQRLYGYH